ncbi:hypothetical protein PMAYCL1PPCAC_27312, partial [Pristionchus mayeri]
ERSKSGEDFIIERVSIGHRIVSNASVLVRRKRESGIYDAARNVTSHLNSILRDYDKTLRPLFNKNAPTDVYIDINVRTMGFISEKTNTYSFDCYFRQTWTDDRLRFIAPRDSMRVLSLSTAMLDRIWKPDVYFWNDAGSYVHTQTVPNRLVRLFDDGTVLFSMRLTVKAKCRMQLIRYPLDRQACRLVIGSFAYPVDELNLHWKVTNSNSGVQIDDVAFTELPQFSVSGFEIINTTNIQRDLNYSALEVRFMLDRHFGYFLMNFYLPCTLIVMLCWVAFWINREATQERIGLVITNVLTMMFMSLDSKADSPKTDYPTALDVYICICLCFLFLCMVEFTIVHYFTKLNTGDPELLELERERMRQIIRSIPKRSVLSSRHHTRPGLIERPRKTTVNGPCNGVSASCCHTLSVYGFMPDRSTFSRLSTIRRKDGGRHSFYHKNKLRKVTHQPLSVQHSEASPMDKEHFHRDAIGWRLYHFMLDQNSQYDPFLLEGNSISAIDKVCRVALPLIFASVVLVYYQIYVGTPFDFKFDDPRGPRLL